MCQDPQGSKCWHSQKLQKKSYLKKSQRKRKTTCSLAALMSGWKLLAGGSGCRRSSAHSGNSSRIFSATETLASSMNSSTIELVSSSCLACTSIGSCVSESMWNRISGEASSSALWRIRRRVTSNIGDDQHSAVALTADRPHIACRGYKLQES